MMKNTGGWIVPEGYDGFMPTKQDETMEPTRTAEPLGGFMPGISFLFYLLASLTILVGGVIFADGIMNNNSISMASGFGIAVVGLLFVAVGRALSYLSQIAHYLRQR